jgi:hypothetical protein
METCPLHRRHARYRAAEAFEPVSIGQLTGQQLRVLRPQIRHGSYGQRTRREREDVCVTAARLEVASRERTVEMKVNQLFS